MYVDGSDRTPLSITRGQTVTSDIMIAFAPAWNPENCRVVVFVQNFSTKGVQQAEGLNPSTTIRYGLSGRSRLLLSVFNALGQHIATLAEVEEERGYHEAKFDGSGLASGAYV